MVRLNCAQFVMKMQRKVKKSSFYLAVMHSMIHALVSGWEKRKYAQTANRKLLFLQLDLNKISLILIIHDFLYKCEESGLMCKLLILFFFVVLFSHLPIFSSPLLPLLITRLRFLLIIHRYFHQKIMTFINLLPTLMIHQIQQTRIIILTFLTSPSSPL